MSIKAIVKRLAKAVPIILANAPAIIAAAKEVKTAVKGRQGEPLGRK